MDIIKKLKSKEHVDILAKRLNNEKLPKNVKIMEVCGTHTMSIARFGIRGLMPKEISLISGPGCPVCVTPNSIINLAISISEIPGVVLTTFGDMMRIPGTKTSLEIKKADGADIRVVYSASDVLSMAQKESEKNFVFISVGFETTTPGTALAILEAKRNKIKNVFFLLANRRIIPAMNALCQEKDTQIDGFLCPGHVSVIIGADAYIPVSKNFKIPCVVTGFEPVEILMGITKIINQIKEKRFEVENVYERVVLNEGNTKAIDVINSVFEPTDANWRGLGVIPDSGLKFKSQFEEYDATKKFGLSETYISDIPGCQCGNVLKGIKIPPECELFGKACKPEKPIGPCMVSSEGACAAYYNYESVL